METLTGTSLATALAGLTPLDLAVLFFTYLLASQLLFLGLLRFIRWDKEVLVSIWHVVLGAGPIAVAGTLLVLYVLFPNLSSPFYRWGPIIVLLCWAAPGPRLLQRYFDVLRAVPALWKSSIQRRTAGFILLAVLAVYFYPAVRMTMIYPFFGNDKLQYAMWGEIIYREASLNSYHSETPHAGTGFLTRPHHAPVFALLHTWNWLWRGDTTFLNEFIVKANPLFFTLAFLAAFPVLAAPARRGRLVLPSVALILCQPAFFTASSSHIDALRLYTVTASLAFFLLTLRHQLWNFSAALLLGVSVSAAVLVHLSALVSGAILAFCYFITCYKSAPRSSALTGPAAFLLSLLLLIGAYYGYRAFGEHGSSVENSHQEAVRMMDEYIHDEQALIESVGGEEELRAIQQGLKARPDATSSYSLRHFLTPEHKAETLINEGEGKKATPAIRYQEARSFAGKFFDPYLYNPVCLLILLAGPYYLWTRRRDPPEKKELFFAAFFALAGSLIVQGTRGYTNYRYVYIFLGPAILVIVAFIDHFARGAGRKTAFAILVAVFVLIALGPAALLEYFRDPVSFSSRHWEISPEYLQSGKTHFPPRQALRKMGLARQSDDDPPELGMELHFSFRQLLWRLGLVPDFGDEQLVTDWRSSALGFGTVEAFPAFFVGSFIRELPPGKILDTHLEDHYHYYARRYIFSYRDFRLNFLDKPSTIARSKAGRIGHGMILSPTLDPRHSHRWLTRHLGVRYLLVQSDQLMQFTFVDNSRFFRNLDLVARPLFNLRNTVVLYELKDEDEIEWDQTL